MPVNQQGNSILLHTKVFTAIIQAAAHDVLAALQGRADESGMRSGPINPECHHLVQHLSPFMQWQRYDHILKLIRHQLRLRDHQRLEAAIASPM